MLPASACMLKMGEFTRHLCIFLLLFTHKKNISAFHTVGTFFAKITAVEVFSE
jgi:hypothetical protein